MLLSKVKEYFAARGLSERITILAPSDDPCVSAAQIPACREAQIVRIFTLSFPSAAPIRILTGFDRKADSEKCKALTGRGNEQTKKFAARLAELNIPVWIRQVLVPGVTDDENDLKKTREWIDSLGNAVKTEVLPYHTLGKVKYEKLGIPYLMGDVPTPNEEQIDKAKKILVGSR